jgi:hypothetical protein
LDYVTNGVVDFNEEEEEIPLQIKRKRFMRVYVPV